MALLCPTEGHRQECKHNTSNGTVFAVQKVCSKWLQERIDDHNIQYDNKYKSGLKVRIQ